MEKVRIFFIIAALLITTAGVFAGRRKFTTSGSLYVYEFSGAFIPISSLGSFWGLTTAPIGAPVTISNALGVIYPLYVNNPTTGIYNRVYAIGW